MGSLRRELAERTYAELAQRASRREGVLFDLEDKRQRAAKPWELETSAG